MKNSMPMKISPGRTKNSKAVKTTEMLVKMKSRRFLEREKSAMLPSTGEIRATSTAAMPTDQPHRRVPSAPPTTAFLK